MCGIMYTEREYTYSVSTARSEMVPDALYGVFEMMDTPPIRSIICLSSSYVWSERWSEKPEVCWFDSDLRHQLSNEH